MAARRGTDRIRRWAVRGGLLCSAVLLATASILPAAQGDPTTNLELTAPGFADHQEIPRRFTCQGEDVSPALQWSGVPAAARSLALLVEDPDAPDPDAPRTTWVHWVVYDLPAGDGRLADGAAASGLPDGARQGENSWGKASYGGPCPPVGRHRYFFRLFALDTTLDRLDRPDADALRRAMEGHVVARAELVGTYRKSG